MLFSFNQGYKKSWFPAKQKWLEYDLKDPLQDVKMTADLKIESESLCCSGQVIKYTLKSKMLTAMSIQKAYPFWCLTQLSVSEYEATLRTV